MGRAYLLRRLFHPPLARCSIALRPVRYLRTAFRVAIPGNIPRKRIGRPNAGEGLRSKIQKLLECQRCDHHTD
jgi:hypothetical protein